MYLNDFREKAVSVSSVKKKTTLNLKSLFWIYIKLLGIYDTGTGNDESIDNSGNFGRCGKRRADHLRTCGLPSSLRRRRCAKPTGMCWKQVAPLPSVVRTSGMQLA
jgi:hypothetical protein